MSGLRNSTTRCEIGQWLKIISRADAMQAGLEALESYCITIS